MMSHWMFNCRKVTQMVSEAMDRKLPLYQRAMIRTHLLMCKYCARFRDQLQVIRELSRRQKTDDSTLDPSAVLPTEARERIKETIKSSTTPF